MNPFITIGITCFNAESSIDRAVESAISQDWDRFEVIVVDDCSTDKSWSILEALSEKYLNVTVIRHHKNAGAAKARNTIVQASKGEYIAFFDDDDTSYPQRIRSQYHALKDYEERFEGVYVACYAGGKRVYSNGYELMLCAIGSKPNIPIGLSVANYLLFNDRKKNDFFGAGTPTCALMARRTVFVEIGGFDENLRRVEDVDFAIRLAMAGCHFIGCDEQLFVQYSTTGEDKTPRKNLESELKVIDKYREYLESAKKYDYAKRWFIVRYYHFSGQRLKFLLSMIGFLVRYPIVGFRHLVASVPNRWSHEKKMSGA